MERMGHSAHGASSDRVLSALGLCKKAGKLAEGFDPVEELAGRGRARLILTAEDLSPKTEKEAARVAALHGIEHKRLPVTMDDIWSRLGRRAGVLAVADEGLAALVKKNAEQTQHRGMAAGEGNSL